MVEVCMEDFDAREEPRVVRVPGLFQQVYRYLFQAPMRIVWQPLNLTYSIKRCYDGPPILLARLEQIAFPAKLSSPSSISLVKSKV